MVGRPDEGGMKIALGLAFLLCSLLAWRLARRNRAYRPVGVFFVALLAVWTVSAAATAYGLPSAAFETAQVAVAAFGLWALARAVMENGSTAPALFTPLTLAPFALGVLLVSVALTPGLREARVVAEESAWAIGTLGAIWSIQRALRRGAEPGLAHLVVLVFTALGATRLGLGRDAGWVPQAFGAGAAILAQAVILMKERRAADALDIRSEQLRADERVGDLVDMEPAVRGRPTRDARAKRGRRQP